MRNYSEGLAEKYIAIGEAIGEARGATKGEALGEAMGIISTARDLGADDAYIVDKLVSFLGITEAEAKKYLTVQQPSPQAAKSNRVTRLRPIDGRNRPQR